jgi:serine/threonine-protein phosphatase 2A activator
MTTSTVPLPSETRRELPRLVPRQRKSSSSVPSEPAPETPSLPDPPALDSVQFRIPIRRILSPRDHELFLSSPTYSLILAFVFGISDTIHNTPISAISLDTLTPTCKSILSILDSAEELLLANPPLNTGSRFGNPAFRTFMAALTSRLPQWHAELHVPSTARQEVSTYLQNSFGNSARIDYGSGHELNFLLWLLCLNRLSILPVPTFPSLALVVFPHYLALMRKVQMTYYLEPAGSHGVWGLDDYQFLPFLFGASQLAGHKFITPKSIHNQPTLEGYSKDYLYLDQVAFINSIKNVEGLRWHSPMLDDISAAKSWAKVEAGMKKMFVKEVLGKLPVMQHFLFGGLIPAADGMSVEDEDAVAQRTGGKRHEHAENTWGDCCGIAVPSSVGAAQEMKKRMGGGGEGLRRLPFD